VSWLHSIETPQLGRGFQIGVIRPIRVDHTDFFQVVIKTQSFIPYEVKLRHGGVRDLVSLDSCDPGGMLDHVRRA
jgi:hypothetical protein